VTVLPVDHDGLLDPAALAAALDEETVLVSVMAANNETGALQPVAHLADLAHGRGALFPAAPEIAASTGSACHSGTHSPSPVLNAMGLDPQRALGAVRLSLGRWSTPGEVDTAVISLTDAVTVRTR
jgi:cysteine sulfinate desulfinase/cysteine desulfurase-like protein